MRNVQWYDPKDTTVWDRVKSALEADWEQTKHDLGSEKAPDLEQNIPETLRQMAGKQPLPKFSEKEEAIRYGHAARQHYQADWDNVEANVREGYHGDYNMDRAYIEWGYTRFHI